MKAYSVPLAALLALNPACTTKPSTCADHFAEGETAVIAEQSLSRPRTEYAGPETHAMLRTNESGQRGKAVLTIKPFQNEAESIVIDDITVENRLDSIELYGSAQITKDKAGLKIAKELKQLIDATIEVLQAESLPDNIPIVPMNNVDNPFK
jgi:hypothetical protein